MARPRKQVRAKVNAATGRYLIQYAEHPGHWFATPESVEAKALRWAERNRTRLLNRSKTTFRLAAGKFFAPDSPWVTRMRAKGHTYTEKYLEARQGHLDNYLNPLFGDADPLELTRRFVDDELIKVGRASGSGAPLASATKSKILYSLNLILEDFVDRRLLESNPIEGIVAYSKAPVKPRSALPRDVLEKLYPAGHGQMIRVWGNPMWASLFCVLNDTGCRPGEVRALMWREINTSERFIAFRHGIESGTTAKIKGTKTNIVRPSFLSERTIQQLSIWREQASHCDDEDFIFTSTKGGDPVSNTAILNAFRRALDKLGFESTNWTTYWLRHSFGTYNLDRLSDAEVMTLMGHSSIVTSAVYRHPDDGIVLSRSRGLRDRLHRGCMVGDELTNSAH